MEKKNKNKIRVQIITTKRRQDLRNFVDHYMPKINHYLHIVPGR